MKEIIVSGLKDSAVERLQKRADANKRSLEDEIRHILTWGVQYIERLQTLAASMKPLEMPKPSTQETHEEDLRRRRELRERLRQRDEEHIRMTQETLEELDEIQRGLEKLRGQSPTNEG